MPYTSTMVMQDNEEIRDRLRSTLGEIPTALLPLIERHQDNLRLLVETLNRAGHPPDVVRESVRDLMAARENDILAALDGMESK